MNHSTTKGIVILLFHVVALCSFAQPGRLVDTLLFHNEMTGQLGSGDFAPYWMTNNRYGLSTEKKEAFIWRRSLKRDIRNDEDRNWKIGYGLEFSNVFEKKDTRWILQELYGDVQYKSVMLSVGQKERPSEMLNPELSSGGLVSGINARPIPQVRFELPDFWSIPGTNDWIALKGHLSYGMYTDNKWQKDFNAGEKYVYSKNSLYHSKAGYLRLGNAIKFPITITGGLEMNTQFAGTAYNVRGRADDPSGFQGGTVKMPANFKAFWNALVQGGSDATDGAYSNREGNTVGAWHLSVDIHGLDWDADEIWKARFYAEHMFEDQSQMFWQYGWKDFLLGTEINLPKNPIVSDIVYEYLYTKDQSGPIYHDHTAQIPDQVSALDNYYNHSIYGAWQHAGYGMGNGLLISPLYNNDGQLRFKHNRIIAHHAGIKGHPTEELSYRILFSYEKSWGTYNRPLINPQEGWTMFVETTYNPQWLRNCGFALAYGHNGGKLLGNSDGFQFSFIWDRKFHKKRNSSSVTR